MLKIQFKQKGTPIFIKYLQIDIKIDMKVQCKPQNIFKQNNFSAAINTRNKGYIKSIL